MKRRGYSLLEILIVLGIIALLLGIGFAAFGSSREAARARVCISNLHQIGVGYALYIADYDGIEPVVGGRITMAQAGFPSSNAFNLLTDKYAGGRAVWFCPSYHGRDRIQALGTTYATTFYDPDHDSASDAEHRTAILSTYGSYIPLVLRHARSLG